MTTTTINPESKKPKAEVKGLGKWKCSGCGKPAKVTPRKPEVATPLAEVYRGTNTEVPVDIPTTPAA